MTFMTFMIFMPACLGVALRQSLVMFFMVKQVGSKEAAIQNEMRNYSAG